MNHNNLILGIVIKYNRGEILSGEEQAALAVWREKVANGEEELELFSGGQLEDKFYELGMAPDNVWEMIEEKIGEQGRQEAAVAGHRANRRWIKIAAAAAVILVVAGIVYLFRTRGLPPLPPMPAPTNWTMAAPGHYYRFVSVRGGMQRMDSTGYGQSVPYLLQLPDGSTANLSYGSILRYDWPFKDSSRELWVEGEARFIVARDSGRKFIVHGRKKDIEVMGTDFNCMDYPGVPGEVTLLHGKLRIMREQDSAVLTPAEQAVIPDAEGKRMRIRKLDNPEQSIAWMSSNPCIKFDSADLQTVIRRAAYYYHVGFHFSPGVKGRPLTGTMDLRHSLAANLAAITVAEDESPHAEESNGVIEVTK